MSGEWISLDVGGVIFKTTVATLTQDPNSMLAAMFSSERPPAMKDDNGNYLIDRNPRAFGYILEFLRNAGLPDDIVGCSLQEVQWEASYFGLDGLLRIIEERNAAKDKKDQGTSMDEDKSQKIIRMGIETFYCELCLVELNSEDTMISHKNGMKHLKKERAERERKLRQQQYEAAM